jgi:hypothetical protein
MTMKFSPSVEKNPDKNRLCNLLSIFWVVQMSFSLRYAFLISVLTFICLETPRLAAARLPQDEGTVFFYHYLLFSLVVDDIVMSRVSL